ncbi:MAG: hypothetical protein RLY86_71 [Pseudomonadota bacterium]|jgi:diadenosine tetraphosphate (Ap4A) HIT family hydrolase
MPSHPNPPLTPPTGTGDPGAAQAVHATAINTTAVNATMAKFGHPGSVAAQTAHWSVQVRPQQPTLGALVLVCREPVTAFGQVSPDAFAELGHVVAAVEGMLRAAIGYQKINYLMLMMVDPDVHFHVIPRYEGAREFAGLAFPDTGWPGPPALSPAVALDAGTMAALVAELARHWPGLGPGLGLDNGDNVGAGTPVAAP